MARVGLFLRKNIVLEVIFIVGMILLGFIAFVSIANSSGTAGTTIFYSNYFTKTDDTFMDFFNVLKYVSGRDPYHNTYLPMGEKQYFPLAYMMLYPFSKTYDYAHLAPDMARATQLGMMSIMVYTVFCAIVFFLLLYRLKKGTAAERFFFALSAGCSGFYLFSLERGNLLSVSLIAVTGFLLLYRSRSTALREVAYLALAIATALKGYPGLLSLLLVYEKRWKDALRLGIYTMAAIALPFLFFHGGFSNVGQWYSNLQQNTKTYMLSAFYYRYGVVALYLPFYYLTNASQNSLQIAYHIGLFLAAFAALTAWSLDRDWKRVLLLVCAILTAPANSQYYNGVYLILPAALLLSQQDHRAADYLYLVLLLIAMNPVQIPSGYSGVSLTVIISNVVVLVMQIALSADAILSIWHRIRRQQISNLPFFDRRINKAENGERVLTE